MVHVIIGYVNEELARQVVTFALWGQVFRVVAIEEKQGTCEAILASLTQSEFRHMALSPCDLESFRRRVFNLQTELA